MPLFYFPHQVQINLFWWYQKDKLMDTQNFGFSMSLSNHLTRVSTRFQRNQNADVKSNGMFGLYLQKLKTGTTLQCSFLQHPKTSIKPPPWTPLSVTLWTNYRCTETNTVPLISKARQEIRTTTRHYPTGKVFHTSFLSPCLFHRQLREEGFTHKID